MRKITQILAGISLLGLTGCAAFKFRPAVQAVEGVIAKNTVWQSTVEVNKDVLVLPGVTLTIKPGAIVRFKRRRRGRVEPRFLFPEVELLVQGTLLAEGTEEKPILFTSAKDKPELGDWAGIIFDNTDNSSSIIKRCRIEFAKTAVFCIASSPAIESNTITHNQYGVVCQRGAAPQISGNEIAHGEVGIASWDGSSPKILDNYIHHQEQAGFLWGRGSTPLLEHNIIEDNRYGIFGAEPFTRDGDPLLTNRLRQNQQDLYLKGNKAVK